MAQEAPQSQAAQTPSAPPPPNTLLDGTPVKLRLSQTISSADAKTGQEIPFEVIEEVKVDDTVIIPKGASAIANVTEADHKKTMGRPGKLNIAISYVRLADSERGYPPRGQGIQRRRARRSHDWRYGGDLHRLLPRRSSVPFHSRQRRNHPPRARKSPHLLRATCIWT